MALDIWFEIPGSEQQQLSTLVLIRTGFKSTGGDLSPDPLGDFFQPCD